VIVKPATLLKFHKALVDGKYRRLFSSSGRPHKPGPKGPSAELIAAAIPEMKRRNPGFGCVRIAQQISHAFGLDLDKDIVRRVLAQHYRPDGSDSNGPSWLTLIAQSRDSLWSVDLFRCESILLRSYLSTDHDPLFRFHRWLANLRVLEIDEIKSVPNVPVSHPFAARLIGTVRREYLDRMFFWNALDLERKLQAFGLSQRESHSSVARR
jgi:putative transposase